MRSSRPSSPCGLGRRLNAGVSSLNIPSDPEKRCWVETSGANSALATSLKTVLVALVAFDRDHVPRVAGTGFVMAADEKKALVISAKHVLTEGVLNHQQPHRGHAASALFVNTHYTTPSLDSRQLRAVWMNNDSASMLPALHAFYSDSMDIAGCIFIPQAGEALKNAAYVPLDLHVPEVGEEIRIVSLDELSASGPPLEGQYQDISVSRRVSIRVGVVTGVHPQGYRQFRWPCFTTSVPIAPGMSGGFASCFRPDSTVSACGIIAADCSSDEAHKDFRVSGESVVACAWPALGLELSDKLPRSPDEPRVSLHELMKRENIPPAIGGIDRISIDAVENGYQIRLGA